jgi:hypothetical protein
MDNRVVIILEIFGGVYTFLLTFVLYRLLYIGSVLDDICFILRLINKQKGSK